MIYGVVLREIFNLSCGIAKLYKTKRFVVLEIFR